MPKGGNAGYATPHTLGLQTSYVVSGDQTAAATLSEASAGTVRYFLSGVDVLKKQPARTIVTFGDSITDGYGSTVDANHRWPDLFAERLQKSKLLDGLGVANEGISGNRVLSDGFGPNALSRFDRDVLACPGVRYVVVLVGINDVGIPMMFPAAGATPSADAIIAGYRQMIARAHTRGVRVIGATLLPYQGAIDGRYYSDEGEIKREAVNAFIRASKEFDGVIDFDAAVRDRANPLRFNPAYDSGDHLHPNDAGYAAMAAAIDLHLFQSADATLPHAKVAAVKYKGVEAEGTYVVGFGLSVYGNASYNSARQQSDQSWVPATPNRTAALGLLYNQGLVQASLIDLLPERLQQRRRAAVLHVAGPQCGSEFVGLVLMR